jgi:hypothetical protein
MVAKLAAARGALSEVRDRPPPNLWEQLRRALREWRDGAREQADPSLVFHLAFTAPLLLGLLALARRLS